MCKCKNLSPTTVVNDVNKILDGSNIKKAYSAEGLNKLLKFKFWKSYLVYVYLI